MARGNVIVGNPFVATEGTDPQMNCLLDRLEYIKSSWKLLVSKLRE